MPGFLKVDGSQKPIAVPWLKESGVWKPVAVGYMKVDGTWRIWYTAEVVDDFNRADNTSLGTASDDFSTWIDYEAGWEVQSNAAFVDSDTSSALAAVDMYKATTDLTLEVDFVDGLNLGVSWWVVDENNYWAAVPSRELRNNPGFNTCPPDFTLEGNQCRKVETYAATYNPPRSGGGFYRCSPGYTLDGSTCYRTSPATVANGPDYAGCRTVETCDSFVDLPTATGSSWSRNCTVCFCNENTGTIYGQCFVFRDYCQCNGRDVGPAGANGCGNITCTETTAATYVPPFTIPASYSCPNGGTAEGSTCYVTTIEDADGVGSYDTSISVIAFREWKNGSESYSSELVIGNPLLSLEDYIRSQSNESTTPDAYRKETGLSSSQIRDAYQAAVPNDPSSIQIEVIGNTINWKVYKTTQAQGTPYSTGSFSAPGGSNKKASVGIVKQSVNVQDVSNSPTAEVGTKLDNFRAE